jgi:ArsR family transcriptional regulator
MNNHIRSGSQIRLKPDPTDTRAADAQAACESFHAHPSKIARVRRRLLDERAGAALAEIFKVLGDLTRVRILDALAQAELCVCDLAALVGLSQSAVSHQLRLLRSMRVVRSRRAGRMVFYALDDEHIMGLFGQGLGHVQEAAPRLLARAASPEPPARRSVGGAQTDRAPRGRRRVPRTRAVKS